MAEELLKSKHAFGSLENLDSAIDQKLVDSYDILFMKDENDKPVIGWIDAQGNPVIVTDEKADLTELEKDVAELETVVATKVGSEEVANAVVEAKAYAETEIGEALEEVDASYEKVKYEITDTPVGTLVDYRDKEIRVMCPANAVFTKQSVGTGGDSNSYYITFKTFAPNNDAIGYIEHLGDKSDASVLTDLKTDKYGRKYQPTWLAIAKYDEATDTWTYYGASSSAEKYIGWDYQIDWYDANGVMIASDKIRINLSNEECHFAIEPSYVNNAINVANAYTDEQVAKVLSAYQIVEF